MLPSQALEAAAKLVAAFPNGGGNAGGGYLGALGAVLCEYPRSVATRCCHPVHGVARETRFLPTVADIVAFCERETDHLRFDLQRQQRRATDFNHIQEAVEAERRLEKERKRRPTFAELKAKYGPNWGLSTGRPQPPSREETRQAIIAEIGQAAFDAMPDAPARDPHWSKIGGIA